jgi:hypothetical protein
MSWRLGGDFPGFSGYFGVRYQDRTLVGQGFEWSERRDLNSRPLVPQNRGE